MPEPCRKCTTTEYWELWIPRCQVGVCKEDLREIRSVLEAAGNKAMVEKLDRLMYGTGTTEDWEEDDKCPTCGHERRYHFAVNDGEQTDAWCAFKGCPGCDDIFGGVPGRPGAVDE